MKKVCLKNFDLKKKKKSQIKRTCLKKIKENIKKSLQRFQFFEFPLKKFIINFIERYQSI